MAIAVSSRINFRCKDESGRMGDTGTVTLPNELIVMMHLSASCSTLAFKCHYLPQIALLHIIFALYFILSSMLYSSKE